MALNVEMINGHLQVEGDADSLNGLSALFASAAINGQEIGRDTENGDAIAIVALRTGPAPVAVAQPTVPATAPRAAHIPFPPLGAGGRRVVTFGS